jgi:hypothetical protein
MDLQREERDVAQMGPGLSKGSQIWNLDVAPKRVGEKVLPREHLPAPESQMGGCDLCCTYIGPGVQHRLGTILGGFISGWA